MEKTCNICRVSKPLDDFHKNHRAAFGRSAKCKVCTKAYNAEYCARPGMREKARERSKAWQAEQPNYLATRRAAWAAKPRDKENAKRKEAWLQEDPEERRRVRRENYVANAEARKAAARAYKRENPEAVQAHNRTRKARKAGAGGTHTVDEVRAIFAAQRGLCANPRCRVELTAANKQLDHVQPVSRGGRNDAANLQWLCAPCNLAKRAKNMEEWLGPNWR